MREKRRKQKPEPTPDPDAERAAAESPTIVRRKVSRGVGAEPEEATGPAEAESATGAPTPAAPSSDAADQFDALGTEIAAVLRQAQETSEKVRTEAAEHALAAVTQAEAQIEQQWTAAAQQLEEATQALEVARQQDRALRQDAADHLANALAARDAGAEILEGATRQLERAEAAARDLEAHAEAARQEAAQIAADLHALAEHFGEGSGVIDLRADAVAPAGADEASAEPGDDLPSPPAESTEST
ncbi:MAG: hypothetical protein ACXWBN_19375 [Acidimicrobiales bacterium]